jgi:hypothetical protein
MWTVSANLRRRTTHRSDGCGRNLYGTGVLEYRSQAETRVMRLHRVQYAVTWLQIARADSGFWLAGNRSSLQVMRRWGFG